MYCFHWILRQWPSKDSGTWGGGTSTISGPKVSDELKKSREVLSTFVYVFFSIMSCTLQIFSTVFWHIPQSVPATIGGPGPHHAYPWLRQCIDNMFATLTRAQAFLKCTSQLRNPYRLIYIYINKLKPDGNITKFEKAGIIMYKTWKTRSWGLQYTEHADQFIPICIVIV